MLGDEKKDNYPTSIHSTLIFLLVVSFGFLLWHWTLDPPIEIQLLLGQEIVLDNFSHPSSWKNSEDCLGPSVFPDRLERISIWENNIIGYRDLHFHILGKPSEEHSTEGSYSIIIEEGIVKFEIDEICQSEEGNESEIFYSFWDKLNLSFANKLIIPVIQYDGDFQLQLRFTSSYDRYGSYTRKVNSLGEVVFDLNEQGELPMFPRDKIDRIFISAVGTGKITLGPPRFTP